MVQAAVAASILYFAIVFLISFLLEKLHLITKPLLKKGFLSSVLFYIGIGSAVLGIYLYGSSKVIGILCCLIGVIMGVLKTSSDSLHAKAAQGNPDAKDQEPVADAADNKINGVAAKTPDTEFNEQVILNVVTGKRASFVYPYMLLLLCFSLCVALFIIAVIVAVMASTFGKAQPDDIAVFFKLIASFDFGNSVLQNTAGTQTDALAVAYSLAASIALSILAVVFGMSIKILKNHKISQRVVSALLPGHKRGFVPCSEGIYKLCYNNLWTKNRLYRLYPWGLLSLYAIDEKKKRIVLKAGKMQMPLIPWEKGGGLFDGLKAIVFGHLPKERQVLPTKKVGYRWGRVAVAVLIIFALQAIFAGWLENATVKGAGTEYCDVRGKIHYSFRPAFVTEFPYYETRDTNGKTLHRYCELHGVIFVILHPTFYVPALSSLMQENKISESPVRSVMIIEMLTLPAVVWLNLLIMTLYAGKPRRSRFNVL
ncbi:MAG: hypothetical protein K6U74_07425 [Firmicutes bacterium]|nr:hypothetical protein [Bacillota bacterium]